MTDRINNNLYIGSGTLYASTVTAANAQISGTISAANIVGSIVSAGTITAPGATITSLYANNNITTGTISLSNTYGIDFASNIGNQQIAFADLPNNFFGIGANNSAMQYQAGANSVHRFYTNASRGTANGALGTLIASITSTGISTANAQISGTVSAATLVGSLFSGGSIGVAGATVGTLYANTITVGNLFVSGSIISNLNVTNGITTGSINANSIVITNGSLIATFNSNTIGSLFTTNGNVGIGITSPSYALHVSGAIYATGDISAFSDKRLKKDIITIDNPLEKVNSLRGVYYTSTETNKRSVGVIAQEIQEILPEVVATDGEYLGVAYGNITGLLIESIKELTKRCITLEKCLSELLLK